MATKTSKIEQEVIASNQWDRYVRARDNGHAQYIDLAKRCDAYYRGDQWQEEDISALEAEGRPALTINTILPTVNTDGYITAEVTPEISSIYEFIAGVYPRVKKRISTITI